MGSVTLIDFQILNLADHRFNLCVLGWLTNPAICLVFFWYIPCNTPCKRDHKLDLCLLEQTFLLLFSHNHEDTPLFHDSRVIPLTPSTYNVGNLGFIPELERSPEGGHGNPLQYSCLGNPMDRGAWRAIVHGVTKSWTRLKWLSTQVTCSLCLSVFFFLLFSLFSPFYGFKWAFLLFYFLSSMNYPFLKNVSGFPKVCSIYLLVI